MSVFARKIDNAWYVVSLSWLVSLVILAGRRWYPQAFVWLPAVSGEALWPLCALSVALGLSALRVLFASTEHTLVTHYATLDAMKTVQQCGLLSLLLLPLLGIVGIAFLYPFLLFSNGVGRNPCHSCQAGIHILFWFALGSVFLWQSYRWLRAGVAFLVGVMVWVAPYILSDSSVMRTCQEFWSIFASQFLSHGMVAVLLWLIVGLSLRWILKRKAFHCSLQQSAYGLVIIVWLGQFARLMISDARFWQLYMSQIYLLFLFIFLTWQGAVSLREVRVLLRQSHAQSQLHYRPYIFGATLPLAFLLALTGWVQVSVHSGIVLLFIGSQLVAFQGFSVLQSIHRNALGHPQPVWIWLRPVLIFLVLYFPFGAIGVALLGSR